VVVVEVGGGLAIDPREHGLVHEPHLNRRAEMPMEVAHSGGGGGGGAGSGGGVGCGAGTGSAGAGVAVPVPVPVELSPVLVPPVSALPVSAPAVPVEPLSERATRSRGSFPAPTRVGDSRSLSGASIASRAESARTDSLSPALPAPIAYAAANATAETAITIRMRVRGEMSSFFVT
jgi:hypothetical protein